MNYTQPNSGNPAANPQITVRAQVHGEALGLDVVRHASHIQAMGDKEDPHGTLRAGKSGG